MLTKFIARDGILAELADQSGERRMLEAIAASATSQTSHAANDCPGEGEVATGR